jgi:hypothetical protein
MHKEIRYPIGEAVWITAGIIVVLVFGDALVLSALAVAIVAMTTAWWTYRKVQHVGRRNDDLASVTALRPPSTVRSEPKTVLAQAPWRGPSAA